MLSRRTFLKKGALGTIVFGVGQFPFTAMASNDVMKLTILHTNDTHSRFDPFPDGSRFEGLGGVARRATVIQEIRNQEEHVILMDAGDIFQGTPYFNLYMGEPEIKAMSMMQYDLATIGNHEFDAGLDGLKKQLPHANFDFVSANYDFSKTILKNQFKPYRVIKKGGLKIGVIGLGVQLEGLVPPSLYGKTTYHDPVSAANEYASYLKKSQKCDLIVVLSHIGYRYRDESRVSDITVAKNSKDIDLIIGGHTHTFLLEPVIEENSVGKPVIINQVGWGGIQLGRLDFYFDKKNKNNFTVKPHTVILEN